MRLEEIINGICDCNIKRSFLDLEIKGISTDSRTVKKGELFFALKGSKCNGKDFILDAVKNGARVVVCEKENLPLFKDNICYLKVEDPKSFLRKASLRVYGNPSENVKTIGITGTNGKTTVSYLIEAVLKKAKKKCGIIGTISHKVGRKEAAALNTTPGFIENQILLNKMSCQKINYCAMEVSSHALDQARVDNINFFAGIFTNLAQDHLDYHKTKENYFKSKSLLFKNLSKDATAIINLDDRYGKRLIEITKSKILTYGINSNADVRAEDARLSITGTSFFIKTSDGKIKIETPLVGVYNIYNILAAVSFALSEKIEQKYIQNAIRDFNLVPGRLEKVDTKHDFSIFIDFAHTEDALKNVLDTIKQVSGSKIILVFGCGGDRDKTKRKKMGRIAGGLADFSIVTSDNPRSENPREIINQIISGFEKNNYAVEVDRRGAILKALKMAENGDVVILAGKGHERYQIIKEKKYDFDEREIIKNLLKKINRR